MTTTSSQPWRHVGAIFLAAAIVAVISRGGFVEATATDSPTDSSCAAVLCPVPSTCKNGKCKLICPAGFANCNVRVDDGCEVNVKDGDVDNCGRCYAKCPNPKPYEFVSCVDRKCTYTDKCVAIKCATYPNSSTTCSKGQCRVACNAGYDNCNGILEDGCEVDLQSDVNNCGKCRTTCAKPTLGYGEPKCSNGVCGY